jgi:hypothetical protein
MSVPTYQSNQNLVLNNAFGSNVNNSTVQTSFPSGTSTSQGHYHFTDSSTNALKLLNCSADKSGGHQFWNTNSTQEPALLLNITRDATYLDTVLKNSSNKVGIDMIQNQIVISNTNHERSALQSNNLNIRNTQTSNYGYITPDTVAVGNDGTLENTNLTTTLISVIDPVYNAKLSSTDLKFNDVSVITTLANLAIKQTNLINVYSSPAIYADGRPPASVPLASSNVYGQFGFYFKNTVAGYKINWYFPPDTNQTVGDVLGLYLRLFNCSTTSNDNTPFLIIYTKPTGSGDYASWYHSSMVYILDTTITPTVNTSYTFFKNVSGTCPDPKHYASTLANMIQSPVNNPRGSYLPTEQILTIAIGSNSASAINSVEFIGQKLGLMTANGTQEFQLGFQL